jgi:hypothetical protein
VESGLSRKTLSGDDNDIGGYLITPHIVKRINKRVTDSSPIRQVCSSQRISTETLDYIIEDRDRASAGWSGETADDGDGGSKSKYDLQKIRIRLKFKRFPLQLTSYTLSHRYHKSYSMTRLSMLKAGWWKRLPRLLVRKKTKPSLKVRALFNLKGF